MRQLVREGVVGEVVLLEGVVGGVVYKDMLGGMIPRIIIAIIEVIQHTPGNLKGESVVTAIFPSRMEASYCTFGFFFFFAAKPAKQFH